MQNLIYGVWVDRYVYVTTCDQTIAVRLAQALARKVRS